MIVGIHMRTHFSLQHIKHAAYFCRQIGKGEEPIANATATLFSSVAYLEATINELFSKASEHPDHHLGDITSDALVELRDRERVVEGRPTLQKFKLFIADAGFGPLDLGKQPSQSIANMMQLRHGLIHYKAYWLDASSDNLEKEDRTLVRSKLGIFLRNEFGSCFGFDTAGWLNHKFAEWCVKSSISFVDHAFGLFKGVPFHDHIRSELTTNLGSQINKEN